MFNAILYSISLIIFLLTAAVPLLRIVEETGAFDKTVETLITCVNQSEADGYKTFHGQDYVKPSLIELQQMKEQCEAEELASEKDSEYFERNPLFNLFKRDCRVIGTEHQEKILQSFSEFCINEDVGAKKYKTEIDRSNIFNYGDELLNLLLISFISLVVTYSTGYVIFGISKISPLALFRGLK